MDQVNPQWFAIRTQFRKEKYVAKQLMMEGVVAYVPILKSKRYYKSKIKDVELPLIPNYAFVKITRSEYVQVLRTLGFLAFVHFSGTIIPIPEEEMQTLKMVVAEEEILKCESDHFSKGDIVEIKTGNLVGMKGELIEENGKKGFVVKLERLGLYLTIAIETHLLRKIKAA